MTRDQDAPLTINVPDLVLNMSDTTVAEEMPSDLQAITQMPTNPSPPLYVVVVLRKLHHKQPVPPPSSSQSLPAPLLLFCEA